MQYAGRNPSDEYINKVWECHSSVIHYRDYSVIFKNLKSPSREEILRIFKSFDKKGRGYISHSKLQELLTSECEKMTEKEVQLILQDADMNKDGELDYSEFCTAMLRACQKSQQINLKTVKALQSKNVAKVASNSGYVHAVTKIKAKDHVSGAKTNSGEFDALVKDDLGKNYVSFESAAHAYGKSTPKTPASWNKATRRGCFYLDNDDGSISSHEYSLELSTSSEVWLSIKPCQLSHKENVMKAPVDTCILLFRKTHHQPSKLDFVGVANLRKQSEYCWKGDLRSGSYVLMPFTTGCRLRRRSTEPRNSIQLIQKDENGETQLSRSFTETLWDMFEMCDLDGNGLLSRDEFNWFQLLTCDEEVDDEAWNIVTENFLMKQGELTRDGFVQLHHLQAREENADPAVEFLDTLMCMGYNKALDLDQACPFQIDVYAAKCAPELHVTDFKIASGNVDMERRLITSIVQMGEKRKLVDVSDVDWYVYRDSGRISFVLSNTSPQTIEIRNRYADMNNCVSAKNNKVYKITLAPNSMRLLDHFMAEDEHKKWAFSSSISE